MVVKKLKDTTFYLLDTDDTYQIDKDSIQFFEGHSGCCPSMEILTSQ